MTGDFKRPYLLRISQKLTKRYGSNHCYPWSVADPDQAFVGDQSNRGAPKRLHLFNTPGLL